MKRLDDFWQYWATVAMVGIFCAIYFGSTAPLLAWLGLIAGALGAARAVYMARR